MSAESDPADPRRRWRRLLPSTARTQIIAWVLLLVLAALGVVTFVTWQLLVRAVDARMDEALRFEVQEFAELTDPGVNPRTGEPFASVEEVIREAIAYNIARPNEKFLGYVDGQYRTQSRQEPGAQEVLANDADAARLMLMLGAAAAAWILAGRILRPLRDVADTTRMISDTDLSLRVPSRGEDDELDRLVATINGMLDRVEAGVSAQRRFIDDAGHELRTPITIVRGHLEVLDPADAEDVASTVALVDDELGRMNRMVSDLLLLAQSEQPSFLHLDLVDVEALTRETFEKITRLAQRDFKLETVARTTAVLDPQRITQALVALADNASRFTEEGGGIGVGSQLSGGSLRFWVTDSGPGVSDEERARIFERFARGGRRRSDGAGLGLSIVRAIAVAHGGDVLLDSEPGRGATFTVAIPAVREDQWHGY